MSRSFSLATSAGVIDASCAVDSVAMGPGAWRTAKAVKWRVAAVVVGEAMHPGPEKACSVAFHVQSGLQASPQPQPAHAVTAPELRPSHASGGGGAAQGDDGGGAAQSGTMRAASVELPQSRNTGAHPTDMGPVATHPVARSRSDAAAKPGGQPKAAAADGGAGLGKHTTPPVSYRSEDAFQNTACAGGVAASSSGDAVSGYPRGDGRVAITGEERPNTSIVPDKVMSSSDAAPETPPAAAPTAWELADAFEAKNGSKPNEVKTAATGCAPAAASTEGGSGDTEKETAAAAPDAFAPPPPPNVIGAAVALPPRLVGSSSTTRVAMPAEAVDSTAPAAPPPASMVAASDAAAAATQPATAAGGAPAAASPEAAETRELDASPFTAPETAASQCGG